MVRLPRSLRLLIAQLPFGLDESAPVGAAFVRLRERDAEGEASSGDSLMPRPARDSASDEHIVDLWTYCYVRRYFFRKFAVNPKYPAPDLDTLVERAYRRTEVHRDEVREPERYPHWVSVVCRNTFLNYARRNRPPHVSLDDEKRPPLPSDQTVRGDLGLAREVVEAAIERLPEYLRSVARLRLLEDAPYPEISRKTDLAVPTARAYVGRARKKLREDPAVRALVEDTR